MGRRKWSEWRSVDKLALVITSDKCASCDGRCCYLPQVNVVLSAGEIVRYHRNEFPYRVENIVKVKGAPVYTLKKRKDGSCYHFDVETGKCLVYNTRPKACSRWFCGKGENEEYGWGQMLLYYKHWRIILTKAQKELLVVLNKLGRRSWHGVTDITSMRGELNGNRDKILKSKKRYDTITSQLVLQLVTKGHVDRKEGVKPYRISLTGQKLAKKELGSLSTM